MNEIFLRAILAALFAGGAAPAGNGFFSGWAVVFSLLAVLSIFLGIRKWIPGKFHRIGFVLIFFVLSALTTLLFRVRPGLVVCGILMAPAEIFQGRLKQGWVAQKTFFTLLIFWIFVSGQDLLGLFLNRIGDARFLEQPVGTYFLAALVLTGPLSRSGKKNKTAPRVRAKGERRK